MNNKFKSENVSVPLIIPSSENMFIDEVLKDKVILMQLINSENETFLFIILSPTFLIAIET